MRRALAFDLDGTLLDASGRLSDATVRALLESRRQGHHLAVATARPLRMVLPVLGLATQVLDALVVSNGARTVAGADGAVLAQHSLGADDADRVRDVARRLWPDCGLGWEVGHEFRHDAAFERIAAERHVVRILETSARPSPGDPVDQLVVATRAAPRASDLRRLAGALGDRFCVTESSAGVIEVSSARADKAQAVLAWARRHHLSRSAVVAFGDGHNDVPLLQVAGTSVAMGNAPDEVKRHARHVTASHAEDGVATFLRRHVLRTHGFVA